MAIVDTDTKSLIINQLTTEQLKELQDAGTVEDGQVYVTTDPLYHDLSNIDAMAASSALATDANGKLTTSTTTATELSYVHGVTSAIQTQLDAKAVASTVNAALDLKAPLASPTFTGTPAAPTAAAGTNTTQVATTAFVKTAIDNATPGTDNTTIETFDNSSASGGTTHDLRLKDNGIAITKISDEALTLKSGETKANATIPTTLKVEELVAGATPVVDTTTISYNSSTQLQTIGVINKNGNSSALQYWKGTLAEYNTAVEGGIIDSSTICCITDDYVPTTVFAGEIVQVSKTFSSSSNHVEFTEKCFYKNYITAFQDRIYIYPSEYTLDADGMGVTFTESFNIGSTVTVSYFKGLPSHKVDAMIEAAERIPVPTVDNTLLAYKNNTVLWTPNEPAGIVKIWAGTTIPSGYLLCDGSAVSRTTYSDLFSAIGTTYGVGDGSSTFNLPNFTNRFIEGGSVGTYISAGLPNITGTVSNFDVVAHNTFTGAFTKGTKSTAWNENGGSTADAGNLIFDASLSNSIYSNSTTVQPPALCMNIVIKY